MSLKKHHFAVCTSTGTVKELRWSLFDSSVVTAWTWSRRWEGYNCCDCLPLDVLPHRSRSSPMIRYRVRYEPIKQATGRRPGHLLVISTLKANSWVTICLWSRNTRQPRDMIAITSLIGIGYWVYNIMHVKSRPLQSWPILFDFYQYDYPYVLSQNSSSVFWSSSLRTLAWDGGWPALCLHCPWMWAGTCCCFYLHP